MTRILFIVYAALFILQFALLVFCIRKKHEGDRKVFIRFGFLSLAITTGLFLYFIVESNSGCIGGYYAEKKYSFYALVGNALFYVLSILIQAIMSLKDDQREEECMTAYLCCKNKGTDSGKVVKELSESEVALFKK